MSQKTGVPEESLQDDFFEFETTSGEHKPKRAVMHNRLKDHLSFWKKIGTSALVLTWIIAGVPLLFNDKGPPAPCHMENHNSAMQHMSVVDEAIADLLQGNCIRESPSLVSCPLGIVAKPGLDGSVSHRLIFDGRYLNNHLVIPKFKYETLGELSNVLEPNDWLIKTDLKSGFHHLDMAEEAWQYLGFEWRGKHYVFTQLPFGLATAPWAFTKLSRELLRWWRGHNIRCTGFIDDTLFAHQSRQILAAIRLRVYADMDNGGLVLNVAKSSEFPAQIENYLGIVIDTAEGVMRMSDGKRDALMSDIERLLAEKTPLTRILSRVIGKLISMHWSFGRLVMLMTTQMQRDLDASRSMNYHRALSPEALEEVDFWRTSFDTYNGRSPIWRQPYRHTVLVDASGTGTQSLGGWAGWFNPTPGTLSKARGHWDALETGQSSTWRELKTLFLVLQSFNQNNAFDGISIMFKTDNQGVSDGVCKGTSRTPIMYELYMQVFWYCIEHNIELRATWIPREDNQFADDLSKEIDPHDWTLDPVQFQHLNRIWGPFVIDLFASYTNHQVDRYYSLHHTPDCLGVDAFCYKWSGNGWCNPPFSFIPRVIRHARWCTARLCLICPFWPSASWWHMLMSRTAAGLFAPFVYQCYLFKNSRNLYVAGLGTAADARQTPTWRTMALGISFVAPLTGCVSVPNFMRGNPNF